MASSTNELAPPTMLCTTPATGSRLAPQVDRNTPNNIAKPTGTPMTSAMPKATPMMRLGLASGNGEPGVAEVSA